MSQLRTDWLSGRSVIVAENRSLRPNEFAADFARAPADSGDSASPAGCPFCASHESQTPPAVYELLDAQGRWQVRVVPNKYPAVIPGGWEDDAGGIEATPASTGSESAAAQASVRGVQEVIVESPRHLLQTGAMSLSEFCGVVATYVQRLTCWRDDGRFPYALVFKNQGPRAGASLAHLHSQLVALDSVPPLVAAELGRAESYHANNRHCPYCRLAADERAARERIVGDCGGYVAFCPRASVHPCEVWLLPSAHEPWFERTASVDRLAGVLHAVLCRLEAVLGEPAYNVMLRTTPWHDRMEPYGHWRIEILPRLGTFAGLEMTTGIYVNPLAPERAAPQLRIS